MAINRLVHNYFKGILFVVLILMVFVATFALRVHEHLGDTLEWIQTHRIIGVLAFVGLNFVFAALPLPASVLALSASVIFGLWYGALLIYLGSLLGAAGGFLLGRWLLRDWVASVANKSPTWRVSQIVPLAIERAVAEEGWKVVLMLRLSPAFPFTAVNYAAGLTCISFWDFMGASAVGLIPVSLAYAYAGSLAVDLKEVVSGHTRLSPLTLLLLGGVSAAFFGAAVALLTMYTRRQLRRQSQEDEDGRSVNCDEEQRAEAGNQQGQGQSDPLL